MMEMKQREGENLFSELSAQAEEFQRLLGKIRELAPRVPEAHRKNLIKRLENAGLTKLPDAARLAAEIALFADRCDISEELTRMESHLSQFHEKSKAPGSVGRTLEFLVQELFREINTTGAKGADPEIGKLVVDAKSVLDKIREQLANIE